MGGFRTTVENAILIQENYFVLHKLGVFCFLCVVLVFKSCLGHKLLEICYQNKI
ncbi:hypothetical protein l11_11050 [Neisseria weaveri LMG 5135]|nr:hypothetical protein l11_11050 [Neisseria weaveri LMG 5135]